MALKLAALYEWFKEYRVAQQQPSPQRLIYDERAGRAEITLAQVLSRRDVFHNRAHQVAKSATVASESLSRYTHDSIKKQAY